MLDVITLKPIPYDIEIITEEQTLLTPENVACQIELITEKFLLCRCSSESVRGGEIKVIRREV